MKTCSRCKTAKPLTEFGRNSNAADGLLSFCRACMKLKNKANYDKHADKRRAAAREQAAQNREAKSEYNRAYRERNRERLIEASRAWRAAGNKANRSAGSKARLKEKMRLRYATDPDYRERIKASVALYRRANPDKIRNLNKQWRARNIDRARKYGREYMRNFYQTPEGKEWMRIRRIKFRGKRQARRAAYYALRYGTAGEITNTYLNWLHKWQDHYCCYCNKSLGGKETIEHIVPLSRGGENNPHNVMLACFFCNTSKAGRLFDLEWTPEPIAATDRYTSTYCLDSMFKDFVSQGLNVMKTGDRLVLPKGKEVMVLSTFWLSTRTEPATSLSSLHEANPNTLLVFDYEWVQRPEAVRNVMLAKDATTESIGARELLVEAPTASEAQDFMNLWHLQGFAGGSWYVGLRHPRTGQWYGMASVRRYGTAYELARVAFRTHVAGGLSRLLTAFLRSMPDPDDILTYADTRYGDGNGYLAVGFEPEGETGGWYGYANGTGLHSRQAYRKDAMATELDWFDPNLTERQLARINGLWRVDGLPQRRFILKTR